MSDNLLYQQLSFFHHIFDLDSALSRFNSLNLSNEQKGKLNNKKIYFIFFNIFIIADRKHIKDNYATFFARMKARVQHYLDQSAYNEYDLATLFRKYRYSSSTPNPITITSARSHYK